MPGRTVCVTKLFLSTPPSRVATSSPHPVQRRSACFYPRHPRGWRRFILGHVVRVGVFLSTPPSRVATPGLIGGCGYTFCFFPRRPRGWLPPRSAVFRGDAHVSIHATLAGGDPSRQRCHALLLCFYPRHPRGWRPITLQPCNPVIKVSIHATLAGGDP